MKKIFLLVALAFASGSMSAQDIITKKNAEELQVKVIKVGANEIEYKEWDNQDGPVYTISREEVFTIKYQNGKRDVVSLLSSGSRAKSYGNKYPKYQGEVSLAYVLGFGSFDRIAFETVHGARISPYFYTGVGVAVNYFYDYYYYDYYSAINCYSPAITLPIFVNFKGYYPISSKSAIYASFDIGASVGVSEETDDIRGVAFYTSIGPGIKFGRGDFSIRYQHMGVGTDAIQFRIGINF